MGAAARKASRSAIGYRGMVWSRVPGSTRRAHRAVAAAVPFKQCGAARAAISHRSAHSAAAEAKQQRSDFFFASFSYTTPRIGYSQLATTSNHQSSRFIQNSVIVCSLQKYTTTLAHDVLGRDVIKASRFENGAEGNFEKIQ